MAGTSSGGMNFEKLEGKSNYNEWKFAMELYLTDKDLWDFVDGTKTAIDDPIKAKKAYSTIGLGVQPHIYTDIRDLPDKNGKAAWDELQKRFEDKGFARKAHLISELINIRYDECKGMADYLNKKKTLALKLKAISAKIEDEILAGIILASLPEMYNPLVMALENCGQTVTTDLVVTRLLQEADKTASKPIGESAHLSKGNTVKKRFKGKCNKCQKIGHRATDCWASPKDPTKGKDGVKNDKKKESSEKAHIHCEDKNTPKGTGDWFIDSGATSHMTAHIDWVENFQCEPPKSIQTGLGTLRSTGIGNVTIPVKVKGQVTSFHLHKVLVVPNLCENLISVSKLRENGMIVQFDNKAIIRNKRSGKILALAEEENGLYRLNLACEKICYVTERVTFETWHQRLGHLSEGGMHRLKKIADGIDYSSLHEETVCVPCVMGKQHRKAFPKKKVQRAQAILELVHSDLCGPMTEHSIGGARYMFCLIDDFSRMTFVYFIKGKDQVLDTFKLFKAQVEKETGRDIKKFRTDNGTEYVNKRMNDFLKAEGIIHQTTVPYSPEQNGVAERTNRTMVERARAMLAGANLPKKFWAEAVNTACYLKNRSPAVAVKEKTPFEVWTGNRPNLNDLKVFGCKAFAHIPKEKRKKWDLKSTALMFVGYSSTQKGYRLMDPTTFQLTVSRDVIQHAR